MGEILQTEQDYCVTLGALVHAFAEPSRALVEDDQHRIIFQNASSILGIHMKFASDLENAVRSCEGKESTLLGDIFKNFAPFFREYSVYVQGHASASRKRSSLPSAIKFLRHSSKRRRSRPQREAKDFQSLLIQPVQRLPRYKLLLQELLKRTPSGHPDLTKLEIALANVSAVAMEVNDSIREKEEMMRVLELESHLIPRQNLVEPGRRLIRQGALRKVQRTGKLDLLHFFLFNDATLVYAKDARVGFYLHKRTICIKRVESSGASFRRGSSERKLDASPGGAVELSVISDQKSNSSRRERSKREMRGLRI